MSKHVHCDKCQKVIPAYRSGSGNDGLDRKLELRLGNNTATADLCDACYVEVFALFRQCFPDYDVANLAPPKPLKPVGA